MALDFGTAIANSGNIWNSAIQNKKARELQEKQQFIENALRQDQLALQQDASARAGDKQTFDQQMELAENYGGKQLPVAQAEQIFTHPKLRELVMQRLQPRLASTSLAGVGVARPTGETPMGSQMAAPSIGVSGEQSAAIEPGMAEIQTPVSSGMRIADMQTQAANQRALQQSELRTTLAEYTAQNQRERDQDKFQQQQELNNARMQTQLAIAGMRQPASEPLEKVQMEDGTIQLVPRSQAAGMSPPRTQVRNNLTGTIADLEAANKLIDEIEALGNEIKWAGTGPVEARSDRFKSSIPLIGGALTNPKEAALRTKIADLSSLVAHERYGAALTGGELGRAKKFLPEDTLNSIENVTRIKNLRQFNQSKLAELKPSAGQSAAPARNPQDPMGLR
jgi:hypothetical protein